MTHDKIILVDLDSVLADTLPHWLKRIQLTTGRQVHVEDITDWDMTRCAQLADLTPTQIFSPLSSAEFMLSVPPMPQASKVLAQLNEEHRVYVVTARWLENATSTQQWLKEHFSFLRRNQLIFCEDKKLIMGNVLIEDRPQTLTEFRQIDPYATVIKVEYPYNVTAPCTHAVKYGLDIWPQIDVIIRNQP